MLTYERVYQPRPCIKCGDEISAPKGPQRYCAPCNSTCSVEGCTNAIRAGGKCTTHYRKKFAVPTYEAIDGKCGVVDCGRELKQKGLCELHYGRAYHKGSVGAADVRKTHQVGAPCKVEGCGKPARGQGYCITHYQRLRTTGEVGGAELLRAAQGEGYVNEDGYRIIRVNKKSVFEHRHVMEKKLGRKLEPYENVHHRFDGTRSINDPENLELWSTQQPAGQRVEDKIAFAESILKQYKVKREAFDPSEVLMGHMAMGM